MQVFYGLPHREGDRILTCQHEYGSNYIAYMQAGAAPAACKNRGNLAKDVHLLHSDTHYTSVVRNG